MSTKKQVNRKAVRDLKSSKKEILDYLKTVVVRGDFNYRTFGTSIEDDLSDVIVAILKKKGHINSKSDYKLAPNKNYFPDFELKKGGSLAIEFKSGNKSQLRKGKWVTVKNSENDMGTLNKWPGKIRKFGGNNIFYIFIKYNFNDKVKNISKIEIEPFYKFLGLRNKDVLKYREKDGNLRPKDFNAKPPIKSLKQFNNLLDKTNIYRSKRVIKKHQKIIREAQKNLKDS